MNAQISSTPFQQISKTLIHCPLFSIPMQCLYILTSLILPLINKQWGFSNFLLVYLFGALSLFTYVTHQLTKNKKESNAPSTSTRFGKYLQKSMAHPEVEYTFFGIIVFMYLICGLWGSMLLWSISGVINILALILLVWYLLKGL